MMPSTAPRENRLRVLIADDNEMVRNHLRASLDAEGDLRVAAVAQDGGVALALCRQLQPDVLVLDYHMRPGPNGLDVLRELRHDRARMPRIVLFTADTSICDAARELGASACVAKDMPLSVLLDAVRAAGAFGLQSRSTAPRAIAVTSTGEHVLVVDDDERLRRVVITALQGAGFKPEAAANGSDALVACARSDPGVIVLDLLLPVMSGRDFLRAYRELPSHRARIVVLTALPDAGHIAAELGCDLGVNKPFKLERLLAAVHTLVAGESRKHG
ncbi:MAG: response regulator transcription factor [Chloroflexi bacterium]|nr:MAG: response regulator transcription factor [Chloroflexota bacterium]